MKKGFFLLGMLAISLQSVAQRDLYYLDQSIVFSHNPMCGTARFRALSGSMGALGGDITAAVTNPAGLAVFLRPSANLTTGISSYRNRAGFYGDSGYSNAADATNFNLSQAGLVFIFSPPVAYDGAVNRLALGINYQLNADYDRNLYIDSPRHTSITFSPEGRVDEPDKWQFDGYQKTARGYKDVVNFMGAIGLNDRFYFGVSLNAHNLQYKNTYIGYKLETHSESASVGERTSAYTEGSAFSFALGLLYKTPVNLRFGLSYTTPQWYSMREDFTDPQDDTPLYFKYDLKTPDRWNAGVAYVFGKSAFIDLDYYRKGYASMHLSPNRDFTTENYAIGDRIRSTANLRMGFEKRAKNASFRLGARWEQSPYKDKPDYLPVGDLRGASAGIGYHFSPNFRIDLSGDYAYQKRDYRIFYGNLTFVDIPDPVRLKTTQTHVLLSLSYAF